LKITWALLARSATKSPDDAGLDIFGVLDAIQPTAGYPFKPSALALVVRMSAELGEDAGGRHVLRIIVSDADGSVVDYISYEYHLPPSHRVLTLDLSLNGLEFPERGQYQFNLDLDEGSDTRELLLRLG
jgi:hypothetical protein